MNKLALIFSSDYELFGDGSGDVKQIQIDTTTNVLKEFNHYGVKLTIMFEYGQYCAYKKYANNHNSFAADNQLIENQLIDAIKAGHGVQLHYHAQWKNAIYDEQVGEFKVDLNYVDITSLEYNEIVKILKEGKIFLENLLTPYRKNYKCIGFRAGSWAVKDQNKLLKALLEAEFQLDSSVVPNTKFESEQVNFEYKNSPHQYLYWHTKSNLSTRSCRDNLIEMPIYTKKSSFAFLKYFNKKLISNKQIVKQLYKNKIYESNLSISKKFLKVIKRNYYMADLDAMNARTLIDMIDSAYDRNKNNKSIDVIPLMFISHSKTSFYLDDLKILFEHLEKKYNDKLIYWTMQEAIEYITQNDVGCGYINNVNTLDETMENKLPILGQKKYLETKSSEYGWLLSDEFLIAYYIDKKSIFKRLVFSTAVIDLNSNLTIKKEKIFLNNIIDYVKENKMCDFIYKAQSNVVFNTYPENSKCVGWGTYQVDISHSEESLFNSFDGKSRNVIRKAIKSGVIVKEESNYLQVYDNIKDTLLRQKSIHYPSSSYIEKILSLKNNAKCLTAVHDNIIQGSLILLYDNSVGYALYAGSIKTPKTGSLDLLHFEAMKFCQAKGIALYDFVGTRLNIKKDSKQQGIDRFKKKFNPNLVKGYAFTTVINPYKYFIYKKFVKLYFLLKGYRYSDPIDEVWKEEKKKILLMGPRFNKRNPEMISGPIVLFEDLVLELEKENKNYFVIDTNKKNYRYEAFSYLYISCLLVYKAFSYDILSLHSSRDYMVFSPIMIFFKKLLNKKISLRKFGGEAKRVYENSTGIKKEYLSYIFKNMNTLFMETKYLLDFYKNMNQNTYWFPNSRSRSNICKLPRAFNKKFVFMSHVMEEKGMDEILEVFKNLDSSYTLDIYGLIRSKKYSTESLNSANIKYKGVLKSTEVLKVLNTYDVVLLPSYKEGYPGIIIEAYSLGMPVITTNLESIMEIVDDYQTGILIEPKSIFQLKKAIKYFNIENYKTMSKLAYEKFNLFESGKNTKFFIDKITDV